MQVVDYVRGLRSGPIIMGSAENGSVTSMGATAVLNGNTTVVPALDGFALRLFDAELRLNNAVDFSWSRNFTIIVVLRVWEGEVQRVVYERMNGATQLTMRVNPQGRVETFMSSAKGSYSRFMVGRARVDDGQWHVLAFKGVSQAFWGMKLSLLIDGIVDATGDISPGIFGTSPDYTLHTTLRVGRRADTSGSLDGDVALLAVFDEPLSDSIISTVSMQVDDDGRAGFVGWGIPI